jgi:aryl-alcohol dehydrogenase-like predicted oxidoreductase
MEYRPFGSSDLRVSVIGVGGGRLGATLKQGTTSDVTRMLREALDSGITFYDTADSYGQGKSEELIGEALGSSRNEVVIATKAGYRLSAAGGFAARLKPVLGPLVRSVRSLGRLAGSVRSSQMGQDFSAEYLGNAIDGSLRRLRTDHVDLYQLHSPPTEVLQRGEAFAVLDALKAAGKIRHYGVSCRTVEDATIAVEHPGVSSVQVPLSLLEREAVTALLPLATKQNVAVVARQPFASGFLVQSEAQIRSHAPLVDPDELNERLRVAAAFRFLATESRTTAQAALQWALHQDGVSVVLPGMSRTDHLRENLAALTAPPLTDAELSRIDALSRT